MSFGKEACKTAAAPARDPSPDPGQASSLAGFRRRGAPPARESDATPADHHRATLTRNGDVLSPAGSL